MGFKKPTKIQETDTSIYLNEFNFHILAFRKCLEGTLCILYDKLDV